MTNPNETSSRWWALAAVGAVVALLALIILLK
jgi:hypothetical protein